MTNFRFTPLAVALVVSISLSACNTSPTIPMGSASASGMAAHDHMAMMDAQMKTMKGMHDKMMNAKTPEERSKLMHEHMQSMQGGMKMMEGMSGAGMGDMKGMQGMQGMTGDMGTRQQMLGKRMEMMQIMMEMMMDRMQAAPMMPMGSASASSMATPDRMAMMDAQMKTMKGMHDKMMSAKTPEERSKLMAEHMKSMQDGMKMMEGMSGAGMGDMKGMQGMQGMQDMQGMTGDMGARHQMMEKRMEMMQTMMKMMMDRMQAAPTK